MNDDSPLGRQSDYPEHYSPALLFAIPRADNRAALGIDGDLPFQGVDIWNAWELTWLAETGQPQVASAEIRVPAGSPNIVESKSLKLYLNSFAMSRFPSVAAVATSIERDLAECTGAPVSVVLSISPASEGAATERLPGECVDMLDVGCDHWEVDAGLLKANPNHIVSEALHSHVLRSLCPVTSQPDTGSVLVAYEGPQIHHESLLRYIVSYRQHSDFHEGCVERMFLDIKSACGADKLSVYARYQRRGGIDINPFRSDSGKEAPNLRLWRQ